MVLNILNSYKMTSNCNTIIPYQLVTYNLLLTPVGNMQALSRSLRPTYNKKEKRREKVTVPDGINLDGI